MPWYKEPITLATIVIAVATVVYAIVTYFLFRKTSQSVEIAQQIFASTNRPYVGVMRIKRAQKVSKEWRFGVSVIVRNVGTVPAYNVKCEIELLGVEKQATKVQHHGLLTLFPKVPILVTVDFVPAADLSQVTFLVQLDYKDVTGTQYWSKCKASYNSDNEIFQLERAEGN